MASAGFSISRTKRRMPTACLPRGTRTNTPTPSSSLRRPWRKMATWRATVVDFAYHGTLPLGDLYKRYAETLCAVDDSDGRMLDALRKRGELDSTLIVYMGDNGFAFGEHGLIDKRTAYEESMRVPMLARCPELFGGGRTIKEVVANIDIMPTFLAAAG